MELNTRTRYVAAVLAVIAVVAAGCGAAAPSPVWTYAPAAAASSMPASPGSTTEVAVSPTTASLPTLGFTAGTVASPRVVKLGADDHLQFTPGFVQVAMGETVTFQIHNFGTAVHEFMVGPLADAFADKEGTPEVADIGPGETGKITYTFSGVGPFAFACHAPGHFEHGMAGYIQLVGLGAPTVGTKDNPRPVWINMDDSLMFMPDRVQVAKDETIRFVLTNSGTAIHEFQVGPADNVAADAVDGVLDIEKDELVAGSTNAVDYTFSGAGPYAFACHEPGHYEAGMKGIIDISGS